MDLDALRRLVPPPAGGGRSHDWEGAERALGTGLPTDYTALIDLYGVGSVDDFLWLLGPGQDNPYLDLATQEREQLWALRSLREQGEALPFEVAEGSAELLPRGVTDNGDVCFWVTRPRDEPDRWTVVVNESRSAVWEAFDGTVTAYLVALLSGQAETEIFVDDFPSAAAAFTPHRPGTP